VADWLKLFESRHEGQEEIGRMDCAAVEVSSIVGAGRVSIENSADKKEPI
jgi:hypothetical protein